MRTRLPNELLAEIVEFLFEDHARPRVRAGSSSLEVKPPWSRIHAVVLASRTFRAIGMRLWFSRLRCVSPTHQAIAYIERLEHARVRSEWNWDYISSIPGVYSWVR
jgi:hypothetical protein